MLSKAELSDLSIAAFMLRNGTTGALPPLFDEVLLKAKKGFADPEIVALLLQTLLD